MNLNILIVAALGIFQPFYTQADVTITSYKIDCPIINPEYLTDVEIHPSDNGKINQYFVNFTIIKLFPKGTLATVKMTGAENGEYTIPTGIDITADVCESINEPILGKLIFNALRINSCPVAHGTYSNPNLLVVDSKALPEAFPPNKYVAEFSTIYEDLTFFSCRNFFVIESNA